MGFSQDYSNVPDWVSKSEGYQTGAMVKYQGNIFYANFWASEPGVGDAEQNGWRFYDELYDVTPHTPTEQAKIIAYIPTWRKKEGFNYTNDEIYQYITHGIVAFLMFSETNLGEFDTNSVNDVNAILADVVNTGHQNGTKISIALGGATDYGFLNLMTSIGNNPANPLLDQAVQNVVNFVNSNNLDGVDLDLECWWGKPGEQEQGGRTKSEGPHPAGYALTLFAQKLKQAMPDKLVSAAVFGTSWYGNNYDSKIADYVDWLGVMTYDLTGSWNNSPVGPHSALFKIRNQESSKIRNQEFYQESYIQEQQGEWPGDGNVNNPILSVEDTLWYWTNPLFVNGQGSGHNIPRNKIAAGVPIYGYDFAYGKDPDDLSGQVPPGYKSIKYKDILSQFPDAHQAPNGNIKVSGNTPRPPFISASGNYPYAHNIYFETPDTAVTKLKFLKDVGCQGVIIWELSNDVWEEAKSIIKALYKNSGNTELRTPILRANLSKQTSFPLISLEFTKDTQVPNVGISGSPAVAVFNNKIYCFHEGSHSNQELWYTTFDVSNWENDKLIPNVGISGSPSLAVFNNRLYCFYQVGVDIIEGFDSFTKMELWYRSTVDGSNWENDQKVPNVGISNSPAVAVFNNKLYCFHEGAYSNQELWYTTFDGSNWENDQKVPNVGISGSPAVAVFNNKIYCFHEGSRSNQELWYTTFDGSNWENDQKVPNVGISGSPAVAVFNNKIYCFHEGSRSNQELWYTTFDGRQWENDKLIPSVGISGPPALAVFEDKLYCFHQGFNENGELWYTVFSDVAPQTKKWPSTIILVHGYADSRRPVGDNANKNKGQEDNFWYWQGMYSDKTESYDVPNALINAAKADGEQVTIKAANWDGRSTIENSVHYLIDVLDRYCTGSNTCDLVGHSTGDAIIGYVLDKFQETHQWNVRTVFVAGGAGGGTEVSDWPDPRNFFSNGDPVVKQLVPKTMRELYNHNMRGYYANVPNIRFVGAGTKRDEANNITYSFFASFVRGQSDGLVPFHSQGGVSEMEYDLVNQAYDAYCIKKHTGLVYSCGQLNLYPQLAERWTYQKYQEISLFHGFNIQMIDDGKFYNHSDEVGRLAEWIIRYKHDQTPWYSSKMLPVQDRFLVQSIFFTYKIKSVLSGKVINVQGGSHDSGADIIQYDDNDDNHLGSQWYFNHVGGYVYKITSALSGLELNVKGGLRDNGTQIIQYQQSDDDNSKWKLDIDGESNNYKIISVLSDKVLTVQGDSIVQYDDQYNPGNIWKLVPVQPRIAHDDDSVVPDDIIIMP
ncbi:glycosyl hydrolase, BNR repeat protein [Calothrix sp. NIES-2100]|uniref:glycosyl hydrolase family 18 protein n=1 Tax=Calothrix sp. NIES-2100 TaxID=1954172 RepID=UPI000B5FB493|nr:glycosyl hydrolase, BNR repeat protein [Calothrix sp. NIES-2100]